LRVSIRNNNAGTERDAMKSKERCETHDAELHKDDSSFTSNNAREEEEEERAHVGELS
jgi:hypothetical protein